MSKYDFNLDNNEITSTGMIINEISANSKILEFGPANGRLTKYMKEELNCSVYIVELDEDSAKDAEPFCCESVIGDIEKFEWVKKFKLKKFDYIIFQDVLEHLKCPQSVLKECSKFLSENGKILITIPNSAHNSIMIDMYRDSLKYNSTGLLDDSHLRFFTYNSFLELLNDTGYRVVEQKGTFCDVGNNEIKNSYLDINETVAQHLRLRTYGNVYQFFFVLELGEQSKIEKLDSFVNHYYLETFHSSNFETDIDSSKIHYLDSEINSFTINFLKNRNYSELRIDLINVCSIVKINSFTINDIPITSTRTNGFVIHDSIYIFKSSDPMLFVDLTQFDNGNDLQLKIDYEILSLSLKHLDIITETLELTNVYENRILEMKKHEDNLNSRIDDFNSQQLAIYSSFSWKITKPLRFAKRLIKKIVKKSIRVIVIKDDSVSCNIDTFCFDKLSKSYIIDGWIINSNIGSDYTVEFLSFNGSYEKDISRIDVATAFNSIEENVINSGFNIIVKRKRRRSYIYKFNFISQDKSCIVSFKLNLRKCYKNSIKRKRKFTVTNFKKAITYFFAFGPKTMLKQIKHFSQNNYDEQLTYERWIINNENYNSKNVIREINSFEYKPLISIIIPVYNVEKNLLIDCIESIKSQYYSNWQICIADDSSTFEYIVPFLKEQAKKDKRINYVIRKENGHISNASNSALELACGEFIALMDNDDLLPKHALFEVVKVLNSNKEIDMIYSDEDKIDGLLKRQCPHFKPDWSPDTFMSSNYVSHLGVYRKSIIDDIKGFRVGYEGSQDYDLVLRFIEKTNNIYHIPKILYHWRMVEGSTALDNSSKSYAYDAGKRALEDYLKRNSIIGIVEPVEKIPYYSINYSNENEFVSVIIPTRNYGSTLKVCLESIYKNTLYDNFEIIVVDNGSDENETLELLEYYSKNYSNFKVLTLNIPFNYSIINNEAVKMCNGEYVIFLNNDTEIITPSWIEDMLGYARQPHVASVGAKLFYPDDTIQHAGVVLGLGGIAGHILCGSLKHEVGYFARLQIAYNYGAVTAACLMVSKKKFNEVNGFDEKLGVAFNDVDLNVKFLEKSYFNVLLPKVQLYHYESKSRGSDISSEKRDRFIKEIKYMKDKWGNSIEFDRFYNANFIYFGSEIKINGEKKL